MCSVVYRMKCIRSIMCVCIYVNNITYIQTTVQQI